MQKLVFSGVQPSNNLTIGNYLGAIKQWKKLQQQYKSLFCVVDLHAITVPQEPKLLYNNTLSAVATYLACGIDSKQSIIFIQSQISAHCELAWILECISPIGWLSRMTQFKDKSGKNHSNTNLGLMAYPTLMAADILLYNANCVPVGEDQKQHLEFTRDIAQAFNFRYKDDFFTIPEPMIVKDGARIMSLKDGTKKMSKSDSSIMSSLLLNDSNDTISLKIRKAKTDSQELPNNLKLLEGRHEAKNLLTIFAMCTDISLEDAIGKFAGKNFTYLKEQLVNAVIATISPIANNINDYLQDKAYLNEVLLEGKNQAMVIANANLKKIKEIIGFYNN